MFTLYYTPNTCALATLLALAHTGASYASVRIDFASAQQRSPAFLAVNPKGRVPVLVTPQGVLTETPALLLYLAQTHPGAGLAPLADPFALAQFNAFNSYLCATVHVAHAHKGRGYRWADDAAAHEAMRKKVPQSMAEAFALVEHDLLRGPWVLGAEFSAADYYLLTLSRWLEGDGVDLGLLPRVLEHRARLLELPLVQAVIAQQDRPAAA